MDKIKDIRRRLAALSVAGVDAESRSPATSLADCRAIQSRLRELKREVLVRIGALRTELTEQARESLGSRPSMRQDWQRRKEGAKQLLAGVQKRVIGLVDGKHGDALEAWSRLSEEIDARLSKLEGLETRLARVAGEAAGVGRQAARSPATEGEDSGDDLYAAAGASARPQPAGDEAEDAGNDDLYAAVGATVRKGGKAGAYCPHCGQGLEPDDRFCRRCGHRLKGD